MSSLPSRQGTSQAVESEAAVPHTAGAAQVPGNINEDHPHHQVSEWIITVSCGEYC